MNTKRLRAIVYGVGLMVLLLASQGMAQNRAIRGKVLDDKQQPLQDVKIDIIGMEMKRNYTTKTNKKGEYYHGGLAAGPFQVTAQKEGFAPEEVKGIRPPAGGEQEVNFTLKPGSGKLASQYTKEEIEKMKQEYEEAKKKAAATGEAKTLFDEGIKLVNTKQYPEAIKQFKDALEKGLDPKNTAVVWGVLADTQSKYADVLMSKAQRQEAVAAQAEAVTGFNEAIKLDPANPALYTNLAVALGKSGKIDEAKQAIEKVNAIDPTKAGMNFYNLGAVLVNSGKTIEAISAFQQATKANPPYEEAFYQLGVTMLSDPALQSDINKSKEIIPVLQEYLKIGKNEGNKQSAQAIVQELERQMKEKEAAGKKAPAKKGSKKGS